MALFDKNSGLENLFGNSPNLFMTTPSYITGLLSQEEQDKLKQQALLKGLVGTAATYLATPKNQNYGSALPYLAKSYIGGMGAAQDVYDASTKNALDRLTLEKAAKTMEMQGMTELDKLIAQRDKIASVNPNDPKLKIYDDAIKTKSTRGEGINLNLGSPVAGVDAQGNPVFFQPSKTGGAPSIVQGVKPLQEPKAPTESQAKAQTFFNQMTSASDELKNLESEGFKPGTLSGQIGVSLAGTKGRMFADPLAQRALQAQQQWAESYLRIKTGAAATEGEVKRNIETFFPKFGETDPSVIQQKERARAKAEQDVLAMTKPGSVKTETQAITQPTGTPKVGDVISGYRFKGGNPADQKNWEKM